MQSSKDLVSNILAPLNPAQRAACQKTHGPVLIVAGAGSGKTRTLTHRIAYLIAKQQVEPQQILAVTFTNKAAQEMKKRLQQLLTGFAVLPTVGTFHAVSVQILRREIQQLGRENSFTIFDDGDSRAVVRQILQDLAISEKTFNPRALLGAMAAAKAKLIAAQKYQPTNYFEETVAKVYPLYEKKLQKANALDFSDLLKVTVELFQEFPAILAKYQTRWQFISIDEFQDTNYVQAVWSNLLAAKHKNLCVIGDPDQSIYSWRGAEISNILEFKQHYPQTQEILLEQNYRSSPVILAAANAVIARNPNRPPKRLWTRRRTGEKIFRIELNDEREEAEFIGMEIAERVKAGQNTYRDFVILYRTNAQSRVLEEVFLRHALPHKIVGGVKFYARKEIKDMLAYLQLLQNPRNTFALLRVLNVPTRTLGPRTVAVLQAFPAGPWEALVNVEGLELPAKKKQTLRNFRCLLEDLQKLSQTESPASLIRNVLLKTKLKEFWSKEGPAEGEARYENVLELISVASKYELLAPRLALATFLEEVALLSEVDQLQEAEEVVTLMTLHTCKGLEFPVVFIAGCEQQILPHANSLLKPKALEEERRLFYVGLTRAQTQLFLLAARNRLFFGETHTNAPSEFLADIPAQLLASRPQAEVKRRGFRELPCEVAAVEFTVGDTVKHPSFGLGEIRALAGGVATVRFGQRKRKLALAIAPLSKV